MFFVFDLLIEYVSTDISLRRLGPLMGGGGGVSPRHVSILRNNNVALSNLRNDHVTLSILRDCHVPCHYVLKSHVACH